jgi:hypothetical protein
MRPRVLLPVVVALLLLAVVVLLLLLLAVVLTLDVCMLLPCSMLLVRQRPTGRTGKCILSVFFRLSNITAEYCTLSSTVSAACP